MPGRRQWRFATLLALAALVVAVPAASASKPGDTEHGVSRAKLMAKAKRVVETREGITVRKISRCGPQKRKKSVEFSVWICMWRAEGTWPGEVPYACAGKAVWKRKGNSWRVDKCANQRQPMVPLNADPGPAPTFGFNDNWIFQPAAAIDLMDMDGGQVARTSLDWGGVEGVKGKYEWYGSDQLYTKLTARGIQPLWVLVNSPCWAQQNPGACQAGNGQMHPTQQSYDEMAQFAVAAARRYPQSIGFEVWNEPNYPLFWGGAPDPDAYSAMLKTVADALHSQVPGMKVVSGGLSPHADTDTSGSIGYRDFLIAMYESGAAQKVDAIGIHPYPGVGPTADYIGDVRVYLGKVQNVMARYGDQNRPLWATEFGASTTGPTAFNEATQGTALTALYDMFRRVSGSRIELAIVHRFVEDPSLGGREAGFGVVSQNLDPKPSFCDLAAVRGLSIPLC